MRASEATYLLVLLHTACGAPQSSSSRRTLFTEPVKAIPGPEKNYTGYRVTPDSTMVAYYHEQTITVVELGPARKLLNCEMLEVKTKNDRQATLKALKLQKIRKQTEIQLADMMDVQNHCQALDDDPLKVLNKPSVVQLQPRSTANTFSTVFIGIFPGTKWCGRGDIAATYFDLGEEKLADKCCRTHDLCPVKVSAMRTQYNITNYSMVTRSHCACDKAFYTCLKNRKSSLTDLIGSLYFNVGDPQCVDDVLSPDDGVTQIRVFRPNMIRY